MGQKEREVVLGFGKRRVCFALKAPDYKRYVEFVNNKRYMRITIAGGGRP